MTGAVVAGLIYGITLDRSDEIRDDYAAANARAISGGQRAAVRLALAYVAALAAPAHPPDVGRALEDRLVTADDPRTLAPLLTLWGLLDDGMEEAQARLDAGTFASELAQVDLTGAARGGLDEGAAAAEREPRYRLEPNPGACSWCLFIAETGARYLDADSVPVPHSPVNPNHRGGPCNCMPAPEFEEE